MAEFFGLDFSKCHISDINLTLTRYTISTLHSESEPPPLGAYSELIF